MFHVEKVGWAVESRAAEDNRLGIYSLGTEEGSNQGVQLILQVQGFLKHLLDVISESPQASPYFPF